MWFTIYRYTIKIQIETLTYSLTEDVVLFDFELWGEHRGEDVEESTD
jgi:hypothetical protein